MELYSKLRLSDPLEDAFFVRCTPPIWHLFSEPSPYDMKNDIPTPHNFKWNSPLLQYKKLKGEAGEGVKWRGLEAEGIKIYTKIPPTQMEYKIVMRM